MKLALLASALAALGLSGCVTGYGYSDDGYYYGRPSASVGSYGSIGYGMGYGYPGYYGYYDPYRGYYYDPYYGYYFRRPPVVIIQRPPGDNHGGHHHDGDDHDGDNDSDHGGDQGGSGVAPNRRPPPWRDLNNLGDRGSHPVRAPDALDGGTRPRLLPTPPAGNREGMPRVRMADPSPPMRLPDRKPANPAMQMRAPGLSPYPSRSDDNSPRRKGDRRP